MSHEPLFWVTSSSGWEEAAVLARLLPPAQAIFGDHIGAPPPNPFLIVAARETAPACDLMLREFGVDFGDNGQPRQRIDDGWTIAATVLFAAAPGKQDKHFRNVADQLSQDPRRIVIRVPFLPHWHTRPISELPVWDFTPTPEGRGPAALRRRDDGIPVGLAADFHRLMCHVRNLAADSTPTDPDTGDVAEDRDVAHIA